MSNDLLAIGMEELLNRTIEILKNQQMIMDKLDINKDTSLSSD
ncbi:hypothetical protein OBG91_05615 [Lactococcus lactis]|nr:hypothetical protein [Lactococcus lactis]